MAIQFDPVLFDPVIFSTDELIAYGMGIKCGVGWKFGSITSSNNEFAPYDKDAAAAVLYVGAGLFGAGLFGMGLFGVGDADIPLAVTYTTETVSSPVYTKE